MSKYHIYNSFSTVPILGFGILISLLTGKPPNYKFKELFIILHFSFFVSTEAFLYRSLTLGYLKIFSFSLALTLSPSLYRCVLIFTIPFCLLTVTIPYYTIILMSLCHIPFISIVLRFMGFLSLSIFCICHALYATENRHKSCLTFFP